MLALLVLPQQIRAVVQPEPAKQVGRRTKRMYIRNSADNCMIENPVEHMQEKDRTNIAFGG